MGNYHVRFGGKDGGNTPAVKWEGAPLSLPYFCQPAVIGAGLHLSLETACFTSRSGKIVGHTQCARATYVALWDVVLYG